MAVNIVQRVALVSDKVIVECHTNAMDLSELVFNGQTISQTKFLQSIGEGAAAKLTIYRCESPTVTNSWIRALNGIRLEMGLPQMSIDDYPFKKPKEQ